MASKTAGSADDFEPEMLKVSVGEKKWDNINLNDFRTSSCWLPIAYGYLWIGLIISVICYCVDIYLCINLLAFNTWSGQVQPAIPLNIAKWIFAGCIILSLLLLLYEWIRAIRVMRKGYIADSYLDPLAVRVQCIRLGKKGRGWRRFLVFGQLTKSKKGAEYVAIFTYFSFKYWIRLLFAEGPRMVINGLTIKALIEGHLLPEGDHSPSQGHTPIVQFFVNFQILFNENRSQAIVLLGMAWVALIWIISFISFLIAICMYLLFLWHHIPTSLSHFLREKIEGRVERIVMERMKKVRRKETERLERKAIKAAGRSGTPVPGSLSRTNTGNLDDTKTNAIPLLNRSATQSSYSTQATLPSYTSRPSTPSAPPPTERKPTLPVLAPLNTQDSSASSVGSRSATPIQSASTIHSPNSARLGGPSRMNTQNSYASARTATLPSRTATQNSNYSSQSQPVLARSATADSFATARSRPAPSRQGTMDSGYGPNPYLQNSQQNSNSYPAETYAGPAFGSSAVTQPHPPPTQRSASAAPAPGPNFAKTNPQTGMPLPPRTASAGSRLNPPPRSASAQPFVTVPTPVQSQPPPRTTSAASHYRPPPQQRNVTSPLAWEQPMDYFGPAPTARSFTAPLPPSYAEEPPYPISPPQSRVAPIPRPGTAGGAFTYPERPKPAQRGWTDHSPSHYDPPVSYDDGYEEPPASLRAGFPAGPMRRAQTFDDYHGNGRHGASGQGYGDQGYGGHGGGGGWNQGGGGGFRFDAI